jgi:hypothetical protein
MNTVRRGNSQGQPVWDSLAGLSAAVGQITSIPALLIPYLEDKALMAKLIAPEKFRRLGGTLERDIRLMTERYRAIRRQHEGRTGGTRDGTELMQSIDLSEQYVAWAGEFDAVVIPTFLEMMQLLKNSGADISSVSMPSATALIPQ